jgi:hypothetical protein
LSGRERQDGFKIILIENAQNDLIVGVPVDIELSAIDPPCAIALFFSNSENNLCFFQVVRGVEDFQIS